MSKKSKFFVKYALVCDDVRIEVNGKQILIGVYTGGILLRSFPANFKLATWCEVTDLPAGILKIEVRAMFGTNRDVVFTGEVEIESEKAAEVAHFAFQMSLYFPTNGLLIIQAKAADEEEWSTIKEIIVSRGPSSPHSI